MKDELARVALGLMAASLALSEFRLKHLSFVRRCPPMLVHPEGNCVAWTCAHLREVADHFGNEGWGNFGHNRRTKEIDGITVAVVGFPVSKGALTPAGFRPIVTTHLDVRGSDSCNASVETVVGPIRTL